MAPVEATAPVGGQIVLENISFEEIVYQVSALKRLE
jgi:hypothetical protein